MSTWQLDRERRWTRRSTLIGVSSAVHEMANEEGLELKMARSKILYWRRLHWDLARKASSVLLLLVIAFVSAKIVPILWEILMLNWGLRMVLVCWRPSVQSQLYPELVVLLLYVHESNHAASCPGSIGCPQRHAILLKCSQPVHIGEFAQLSAWSNWYTVWAIRKHALMRQLSQVIKSLNHGSSGWKSPIQLVLKLRQWKWWKRRESAWVRPKAGYSGGGGMHTERRLWRQVSTPSWESFGFLCSLTPLSVLLQCPLAYEHMHCFMLFVMQKPIEPLTITW